MIKWASLLYSTAVLGSLKYFDTPIPIDQNTVFGSVAEVTSGNVRLGLMIFEVDARSGKATSVDLEALRIMLDRKE
jgi:hypothetical protein